MKGFPLKPRDLKRFTKNATLGRKLSLPYAFSLMLTVTTDYFHTVAQHLGSFCPI